MAIFSVLLAPCPCRNGKNDPRTKWTQEMWSYYIWNTVWWLFYEYRKVFATDLELACRVSCWFLACGLFSLPNNKEHLLYWTVQDPCFARASFKTTQAALLFLKFLDPRTQFRLSSYTNVQNPILIESHLQVFMWSIHFAGCPSIDRSNNPTSRLKTYELSVATQWNQWITLELDWNYEWNSNSSKDSGLRQGACLVSCNVCPPHRLLAALMGERAQGAQGDKANQNAIHESHESHHLHHSSALHTLGPYSTLFVKSGIISARPRVVPKSKWDRFQALNSKHVSLLAFTQAVLLPPAHERLRCSIPHHEQGPNSASQLFWNKLTHTKLYHLLRDLALEHTRRIWNKEAAVFVGVACSLLSSTLMAPFRHGNGSGSVAFRKRCKAPQFTAGNLHTAGVGQGPLLLLRSAKPNIANGERLRVP